MGLCNELLAKNFTHPSSGLLMVSNVPNPKSFILLYLHDEEGNKKSFLSLSDFKGEKLVETD